MEVKNFRINIIEIEQVLSDAERNERVQDFIGAIKLYKKGLSELGNSYLRIGVIDDSEETEMCVLFADIAEHEGSLAEAAAGFRKALLGRIKKYKYAWTQNEL
jgi:hypothetical protein